jgi:2TM domain
MTADHDAYARREEARRWVRRKRIFYTVVGIYFSLSLMWFAIDLLDDSSGYWFYWPMLGTRSGRGRDGGRPRRRRRSFRQGWESRQIKRFMSRSGDDGDGSDARP